MADNKEVKEQDPGANLLGRNPEKVKNFCLACGGLLILHSGWGYKNLPLQKLVTRSLVTTGLFSTAHAFSSKNYKPSTSRFPFGHTSTKKVLFGLGAMNTCVSLLRYCLTTSPLWFRFLGIPAAIGLGLMGLTCCLKNCGFGSSSSSLEEKAPDMSHLANEVNAELKARIGLQPSCFKVKAKCKFENLNYSSYPVWFVENYKSGPAITDPTLEVVQITQILKPIVAFGFGLPNVYLMKIAEDGSTVWKVDATSVFRKETVITKIPLGYIQAGYLIVPENLPQDAILAIEKAATQEVGNKKITCVRTNAGILYKAGFTITGQNRKELEKFTFPGQLLEAILRNGLEYNGKSIPFTIIRTTSVDLATFCQKITSAVITTPIRHSRKRKSLSTEEKAKKGKILQDTMTENATFLVPYLEEETKEEQKQPRKEEMALQIQVSNPSQLGQIARRIWGPHPIFIISLKGIEVAKFLPTQLSAFPNPNPSWISVVKRDVLFAPIVLDFLNSHLAPTFTGRGNLATTTLAQMLPVNEKRNIIITDDELVVSPIGEQKKWSDWIFCKHILMSKNKGVHCPQDGRKFPMPRFAGEVYQDAQGVFHITGNSGTFVPTKKQIENAAKLARSVFQGVQIVVDL